MLLAHENLVFLWTLRNKVLGKQSAYINQNRVLSKLSSLVWNISNETEPFTCPRSRHVHVGLDVLWDAHGQPPTHKVHAGRKYTHVTSVCPHVKNILVLYIPRAKQLHRRAHTTHNTQPRSCTPAHGNAARLHKIQPRLLIRSAGQTNKQRHTPTHTLTHSHKHTKNQPLGSKFHFISRAGKEQAGESIHAVSSCAEGGFRCHGDRCSTATNCYSNSIH